MAPLAIALVIPAVVTVTDELVQWLLTMRDVHRARKATGHKEDVLIPDLTKIGDNVSVNFKCHTLIPGRVLKKLRASEFWSDIERGEKLARKAMQDGEISMCKECGM